MLQFTKIPTKQFYRTLGIEIGRNSALVYRYVAGTEEIVNIESMAPGTEIDWCRQLDAEGKKRVSRLYYNRSYCTTLKLSAIKTYLLSFFYLNDLKEGRIDRIGVSELAEEIGCSERTVWSALKTLEEFDYITYEKLNPRFVSIQIRNYLEMFRKASEGGKGFITLSRDACSSLLSIHTINDFRIAMKALFSALQNEYHSSSKAAASVLSFAEIRESLPDYIKPCHIRQAFLHVGTLLGSVRENYKDVAIRLGSTFSSKTLQAEYRKEARNQLTRNVREINLLIREINQEIDDTYSISQETLSLLDPYQIHLKIFESYLGKEDAERYKLTELDLNSSQLDSLANLASLYSTELVQEALATYYEEYIMTKVKVDSPAALITAILKENLELSNAA